MKILAVIPARAGSTRLPNKNIYPLLGKPLIRWSTEAVLNTKLFSDVLISTNSDLIFNAVSDLPVKRHHRRDHVSTESTVLDGMMQLVDSLDPGLYDAFGYFLPTCPFISASDIASGVRKLESGCDSVVSMTEITETVQLSCLWAPDDVIVPIYDNLECGMTNSKYIKHYYKPSGGFYMARWDYLVKNRNFFKGITKGVLIPHERSIDINVLEDIKYAESIRSK